MNDLADLKETLDGVADRVHARPPLREDIDRSLRRVTRRRRATRAAQTTGALLCVVALAGAAQVTGVPLPSWAPAVRVDAARASALAGLPTRGSLAGDVDWLRGLQEKVATFDRAESGGERWRAPSADAVDVIFAGDVGAYRVAVVETPLRWGAVESRQQITYVGVVGAAPGQMEENGNGSPQDVVPVVLSGVPGSLPGTPAVGILLGPAGLDVRRLGALTVRADGSVRIEDAPVPASAPGVWVVETPRTDPVRLTWGDRERVVLVGDSGPASWGGPGEPTRAALVDGVGPARRVVSSPPDLVASVPTDDRLADSVAAAQFAASMPFSGTTRRLEWSGTVAGLALDLVEVVAPSGGHALVAVQGDGLPGDHGTAVAVAAAAKGEPALLAWTFQRLEQIGVQAWEPRGPFQVVLAGPPTAVRALVATASGDVEVPLVGGLGHVAAEGAGRVTFLDAEGAPLGTTDVTRPVGPASLGPVATG